MNRLILYLSLCFSIISCNMTDSECEKVMLKADEIMESNQDSAKVSILMLDSISVKVPSLPEKQRMRYHLLYAKAMNKAYIDFTTDSVMKEVAEYYDNHGTDEDRLMANYLLGCVYRDMKDSPNALHYLDKATECANENKGSYLMLCRIFNQKAYLLHKQVLVKEECKALDKAAYYAMLAGDTINAILTMNQKAAAFSQINNVDSAIFYNNSAINRFMELGKEKIAAQISGNCIRYYIKKEQYDKAKELINTFERFSGYVNNNEVTPGHESYYYIKGIYYVNVNKPDSALIYFNKCAEFSDYPYMQLYTYRGLSLLYNKIGKADSTAKYAMLAYEANDSLYQKDAAEALLRQQASYNYERYQEEAKRKSDDIIVLQWWLMGAFIAIICTAGSAVHVHRRIKRQHEWKLSQAKERYETEKRLLQNEMEDKNALLEEKEALLENRNLLFEQKRMELDNEIAKKELSISELHDRVSHYEQKLNIRDNAIVEDEIQSSKIRAEFERYTIDVRKHPSERQWKRLTAFAKKNLPQMYLQLNKYNLSDHELRICILARLRFKPGEIATIMDCKLPDVSHVRSRLLKKIYGIDDRASEFDRRLMLLY